MPIVLVRVDDRLIHGQITTAWIAHARATRIAISSDEVAGDSLQKTIIGVTKPPDTDVDVLTAQETIRRASSGEWGRERVFVICKYPRDALTLVKAGLGIDEINVGNVGGMTQFASDARTQVHKSIALTEADAEFFREILSAGVALEVRVIPQDRRIDMATLLDKA